MKQLVRHLWDNNRSEIIDKSRANCHCQNLDSIMLLESPGKTIRLFFAHANHPLHNNNAMGELSVGFHPHHCNITLMPVLGRITNWRVYYSDNLNEVGTSLSQFRFDSKLRNGKGSFKFEKRTSLITSDSKCLREGDALHLCARELHTVYVETGREAAWFVFEGREDPCYEPLCFSNADLELLDMSQLYKPVTEHAVWDVLDRCNLI